MENYYLATMHFITKSLADVEYPISKTELIAQTGDTVIPTDFEETVLFKEFLVKMKPEHYDSAAALFNALVAVM